MLLTIAIISLVIVALEILLQAKVPTYYSDSPMLTLALLGVSIIAWWTIALALAIILLVLWIIFLIVYMR